MFANFCLFLNLFLLHCNNINCASHHMDGKADHTDKQQSHIIDIPESLVKDAINNEEENAGPSNDKFGKEIVIHGHHTDKQQQSHIINKVERVPEHSHIIDIEWVPEPFLVKDEINHGGENARSKMVYGNVPYNEDSLFSSIVQILNSSDANAEQQKQQQQALRRLTAEAMLEDSKNPKKNNYKSDLRREVLEKMVKKRLKSLELANDKDGAKSGTTRLTSNGEFWAKKVEIVEKGSDKNGGKLLKKAQIWEMKPTKMNGVLVSI